MPTKKIIIDERLFAHINNDAFLIGSSLQGDRFARTIGFLNQYMTELSQAHIPDSVKQLCLASEKLVGYENDIQNIQDIANLRVLACKIHTDIQDLKSGEYLLVPGGWSSLSGGHAMIYRYSLDEEGNLLFSVNNSGSGLLFHEKNPIRKKSFIIPN